MPKTSDNQGLSKAEMSDCLEVVESLSQKEKNKILSVLQKDEKLRQGQEMKINLLKKDIQEIRMKGILRAGDDQEKMCRRCRTELGFLFNRGSICPICRFKVCRSCQEFMFNGSWICIFCYKTRQLKWMTGEWATFQQNPLRKWASGSDIIRASFQLKPGPSIDIDEPQQNGSNKQSNKSSRNGKAGGEPARSRVDAPKDADQHKLSQLFDVLRPKRPEESVKETQIRRVTSRRYHESDSDSSSSSDLENKSGQSSPHALSVTESEKDAQVGVVDNGIESQRLSDTGSVMSTDSNRTSASNDRFKERPIPAPRSPKPSPRKIHSDIVDPDKVVRPKVRPERKSEDNRIDRHANLSVDDSSRVTLSRSVDTNLGKSHAEDIDRNRRALSDAQLNDVRKSNQQLNRKSRDQLEVEVCEEQIVASQKPVDNESAILMNDSPVLGRKKSNGNGGKTEVSVEVQPDVNKMEKQQQLSTNMPGQDDEIRIQVPRGGSPYSISMDSLPSSHPSPTLHRGSIGGSSHADSSDTDSLSRMSHAEHGEFSGTESAHHAHDEDFDVEEISKVRFQRVSKNLGQMGVLAKLAKSPRTDSAEGIELEKKTQEAIENVGIISGSGVLHKSSLPNTNSDDSLQLSSDRNIERVNVVRECQKVSSPQTIENSFEIVSVENELDLEEGTKNVDDEREVFEDVIVATKYVKPESSSAMVFDKHLDRATHRSADELSWYHEIEQSDDWEGKQMKPHPRHSSLISSQERMPSESDSIEGMIDDMMKEGPIRETVEYGRQASSGMGSESSFCMTPISPLPREMFQTNKTATYKFAYNSDDNILDDESDDGEDILERRAEYGVNQYNESTKIQLQELNDENNPGSIGSLDLILHNQADVSSFDDYGLDYEVQEALRIKSDTVGKSNSSSLESLDHIVEKELLRENFENKLDEEFNATVTSFQKLSADCDDRLHNTYTCTKENEESETSDIFESKGDSFHVERKQLEKKKSLDILMENQHDHIDDSTADIDLSEHFKFLADKRPRAENPLHKPDMDEMDGISDEKHRYILASQQKKDFITEKMTFQKETIGKGTCDENSNHESKCDIVKPKIKPMSSLDKMLYDQKDLFDTSEGQVEIDEEFVSALEIDLNTKKAISAEENNIHAEFTYLGIKQNVSEYLSKDNIYHEERLVENQKLNEEDDHNLLFGESQISKPTKLAIRTMKAIPIGYLGQNDSDDSDNTDVLSVIEEENEIDLHSSEEEKGDIDFSREQIIGNNQTELPQVKGIVSKQKEVFENRGSSGISGELKGTNSEREILLKGNLFTKARDRDSKVRVFNSSKTPSHIAEKAKVQHFSKLQDKFKRIHDHWVAVEHHEADILDLDDEEEDEDCDDMLELIDSHYGLKHYENINEVPVSVQLVVDDNDEDGDVHKHHSSSERHVQNLENKAKTKKTVDFDIPYNSNSSVDMEQFQDVKNDLDDRKDIAVLARDSDEAVLQLNPSPSMSDIEPKPLHTIAEDPDSKDITEPMVIEERKDFQKALAEPSQEIHKSVDNFQEPVLDNVDSSSKVANIIPTIKVSTADSSEESEEEEDGNDYENIDAKENNDCITSVSQDLPESSSSVIDIHGSGLCHSISNMSSNLGDFGHNSPLCESIAERRFDTTIEDLSGCEMIDIPAGVVNKNNSLGAVGNKKGLHICYSIPEKEIDILKRGNEDKERHNEEDKGKDEQFKSSDNSSGSHKSIYTCLSIPDADQCVALDTRNISESSVLQPSLKNDDRMTCNNSEATPLSIIDIHGPSLCHSISDMKSNFTEFGNNSPLCQSIAERPLYHPDILTEIKSEISEIGNSSVNDSVVTKERLQMCNSIPDGEPEVLYRVNEDSETCHSIDESVGSEVTEQLEIVPNTSKDSAVSKVKLIPLTRVSAMSQTTFDNSDLPKTSPVVQPNPAPAEELDLPKTSSVCESSLEIDLTQCSVDIPHPVDNSNMFKAPGTPPGGTVRARPPSSSSVQSSPVPSTSSSIEELGYFKSEKLAGFHDAPQTISECSVSQDDSGLVSGGSRGATPEHRRTDSGYSQSSLPSTLSTVTDRSEEEEDIDKVIASINSKGSRGNLLSAFSDSRESIASYYSDAGNIAYSTVPVTGDILFSINYNYKTSMLEIGIKQCKDIAAADTKKNRSDPYVKTYLLPDRTRSGKRKTKVKKHTLNPTFDETLKYSISKSELENRTLWVTLWHSDRFGRNIFLGEVTINFDYYKFDNPSARWYQLQERIDGQPSSMMVYKGDLSLCIRYVPADKVISPKGKGKQKKESSKGQLEVIVKEARNLTAVRSNGFSDPFCKGYLLPERHKSSKQKTAVIKKDCNPVWNHTLIFEDVSLMELRERCLELTIWDYEKLSSNDFLGGVRLNLGTGFSQGKQVEWMDARGEEMSMWQAMLDRPNLWIDGALILRPNMDKRQY